MKFNKILILLTVILAIISCVDDDEYAVPKSLQNKESTALNSVLDSIKSGEITLISIKELKNGFFKSRRANQVKNNYVVKGFVTSSDESGNFYKEFYMQDKSENPTAGIKVALNLTNSYNHFNIGREVYIRLKGLYIGETRAGDYEPTIGGFVKAGKTELNSISENQLKQSKQILRSVKTDTITPLSIKFSEIKEKHIGLFVKVSDASFDQEEQEKTYFNPKQDFDTERKMISCEDAKTGEFYLETSSFANFGAKRIPSGGGSISGVIIKDYDRNLRMAINTTDDVKMDGEICTPQVPVNSSKGGKFDFEDVTKISTSYSTSGSLTSSDGTQLEFVARTNVGKYKIDKQGLMLKNTNHVKVTFSNGVKQLKFKYRGAFTNSSDRVVIIYEGDENSTKELVKKAFMHNVTSETLVLDVNKTGVYTVTIKGGTTRQIVIDDIEWTN